MTGVVAELATKVSYDDPHLWGVDEIRVVSDFEGRYLAGVTIPGTFVWNAARRVERQLPVFEWRIGAHWFGAVVEVDPDDPSAENPNYVALRLRQLIRESRECINTREGA